MSQNVVTRLGAGNGNGKERDTVRPETHDTKPRSPLSTSELAEMVGLSASDVRMEIKRGGIRAVRVGHGRKGVYRIPFGEAMRYLRRLGLP